MSSLQNQRRRGRSRNAGPAAGRRPEARFGAEGTGAGSGAPASSPPDALAELRRAVASLDSSAFADCFCDAGWLRVPHPDGDAVLRGRPEIRQAAEEIRELLTELRWAPSQRFVTANQVVEEAVAVARTHSMSTSSDQLRVSLRVVAVLDPNGGIGSLTLWVDWAALKDPLGVDSPRGAASALVAQARAQDERGLRVIEPETLATGPGATGSETTRPGTTEIMATGTMPPRTMTARTMTAGTMTPGTMGTGTVRSGRPPGAVLWWRRHRATLAGSVMAVAAAMVIGWVALGVLKPVVDSSSNSPRNSPSDSQLKGARPTPAPSAAHRANGAKAARHRATVPPASAVRPSARSLPRPGRTGKPTVQAGEQITLTSAVLFRSNSTDLTPAAKAKLQTVADRVRRYSMSGTIQVNGYTDAIGSAASNVTLSQRRADAVATALRGRISGLAIEITPQAFGEDAPIASNQTSAGRQANRRVTIVLPKQARR